MNNYEGIFIFSPRLSKDEQQKIVTDITESINKEGGKVGSCSDWGRRQLSYRIKKHGDGNFVFFEFQTPPQAIAKLKSQYKLNEKILKVYIIKKG